MNSFSSWGLYCWESFSTLKVYLHGYFADLNTLHLSVTVPFILIFGSIGKKYSCCIVFLLLSKIFLNSFILFSPLDTFVNNLDIATNSSLKAFSFSIKLLISG